MSASNLPAGAPDDLNICPHGIPLMRECFFCEEVMERQEQHLREERQREADRRIVEFHQAVYGPSSEDSWADQDSGRIGDVGEVPSKGGGPSSARGIGTGANPGSRVAVTTKVSGALDETQNRATAESAPSPEAPEDVCRGCGQPWISHMRTPADAFCGECRFADREDHPCN